MSEQDSERAIPGPDEGATEDAVERQRDESESDADFEGHRVIPERVVPEPAERVIPE